MPAVRELRRCCGPTGPSLRKTVIRPARAAVAEGALDGRIVALEVRVAVQHEERIAEQRQRALQGAAGAEQRRAVEDVVEPHAQARPSPSASSIMLAEWPTQNTTRLTPLAPQQLELVRDERLAGDLDERLGDRRGDRPQPRGQAAGEDRDRQAHPNSDLRPLEVEAEAHLFEAGRRHRARRSRLSSA